VIWQESRFKADAVGPVTRSGQRAFLLLVIEPNGRFGSSCRHRQPFPNYGDKVRFAFNHAEALKKRDGKYPKRPVARLDSFI
jgi:hypothetical protein